MSGKDACAGRIQVCCLQAGPALGYLEPQGKSKFYPTLAPPPLELSEKERDPDQDGLLGL